MPEETLIKAADTPPPIDAGDTAWLLVCTALVLLMTPALALFYGGMVRRKNVLSTIMHSMAAIPIISIAWALFGYIAGLRPDARRLHRRASSTPRASSGRARVATSTARRADPRVRGLPDDVRGHHARAHLRRLRRAHEVHARTSRSSSSGRRSSTTRSRTGSGADGGWLAKLGALDFAGGTVVHLTAGISALVCALVIGKRAGYPQAAAAPARPHDDADRRGPPLVRLVRLQRGQRPRRAGSSRRSPSWRRTSARRVAPSGGSSSSGATAASPRRSASPRASSPASSPSRPAAGYVAPWAAIVIGLIAGVVCYGGVLLKNRFGYDDSLDAFGVHGVGGFAGAAAHGRLRAEGAQRAGGRRRAVRQLRAARHPGPRLRRVGGLRGRDHVRHPQAHRRDHRPARARERRARGPRTTQHGEEGYA